MCYFWSLLGKGLENNLMSLVLPDNQPLSPDHEKQLLHQVTAMPEAVGDLLRLGIHYAETGAVNEAEGCFNRILCTHPDHADAHLAWAGLYAMQGQLHKAIEQLQQVARCQPNDPRYFYALGYCLERQGKTIEAQKVYHQGSQLRSYHLPFHSRSAAIHLVEGDLAAAIEHGQQISADHPEDVASYLTLAQLYMTQKNYTQAIATFERALTIEPDNFELHDDNVESLIQSGQIHDAIEQIQKIIETQGDFPDSYIRLGDLYSQLGDDRAATENYQKALHLHPGYLEAAVKLGTQHMRTGRLPQAATAFNRAVEINDQLISTYAGLALAERLSHKGEQSDDTLDLALALEPNTNLLLAEMARLQMKMRKNKPAEKADYDTSLLEKHPPSDPDKLLEEQIRRHRQALRSQCNDAGLHYRMAVLLRGRGQTKKAIDHLQKAVEINPAFARARIKLALALRETGQRDAAWEQITQALQLDPHQMQLHYKLALLYCDRLEFSLAVETFQLGLEAGSDQVNTQANLMVSLQMMGLVDPMTATWRALCEMEPGSPLAFQSQRSLVGQQVFHS